MERSSRNDHKKYIYRVIQRQIPSSNELTADSVTQVSYNPADPRLSRLRKDEQR